MVPGSCKYVWSEDVYDILTIHPPLFIERKIYENLRGGVKTILGGETDKKTATTYLSKVLNPWICGKYKLPHTSRF